MLALLLCALGAVVLATPTTTGLSVPADASLAEDRAVYFIDSVLRFDSVPLGTQTLTRAEALAECGATFASARWTPYRLRVHTPAVITIPAPVSYDGTRMASRLRWWVCGNGTHEAVTSASIVTSVSATKPAVYVLAAGDCAGGYDCYECTAPNAGCDCRGEINDTYDVAYTVAVCVLLGLARALRVYRSDSDYQPVGSHSGWADPHAQLHALEMVGYSVAAAHSIDLALRWGWDEAFAVVGMVAACIMAILTLIAFLTPASHKDTRPPSQTIEQAWDFLLVVVFCFYTFASVVTRRPSTPIVVAAFLVLLCFVILTLFSNVGRIRPRKLLAVLKTLSVVGVAAYALPFMGEECANRFV